MKILYNHILKDMCMLQYSNQGADYRVENEKLRLQIMQLTKRLRALELVWKYHVIVNFLYMKLTLLIVCRRK